MATILADDLAKKRLPLEFWRAVALGVLRRTEAKEPMFAEFAKEDVEEALHAANALEHARRAFDQNSMDIVTREVRLRLATQQLETTLATLKVDRRKLPPIMEPIPRPALWYHYFWLVALLKAVRRNLQGKNPKSRYVPVARRVGEFVVEMERLDGPTVGARLATCGDETGFWTAVLEWGFFRAHRLAIPKKDKLEEMAGECQAALPAQAALEILKILCYTRHSPTGKPHEIRSQETLRKYMCLDNTVPDRLREGAGRSPNRGARR